MITLPYTEAYIQDRLNNLFTYTNDLCLSKRMNPDKSRNEYGSKLLKLCKSTGLRILNGRHGSGFANDYAYCGATYTVEEHIEIIHRIIEIFLWFKIKIFTQKIKLINIWCNSSLHWSLYSSFQRNNFLLSPLLSSLTLLVLIMAPFFEVKHDSVKNGKPNIYNKPRNDDKPWFTDECKRLYRIIWDA
jgi:hypothetical protein